jgi:hypothetical protein
MEHEAAEIKLGHDGDERSTGALGGQGASVGEATRYA